MLYYTGQFLVCIIMFAILRRAATEYCEFTHELHHITRDERFKVL